MPGTKHAILGETHRAGQRAYAAIVTAYKTCSDDGTVFIVITWEEVTM